MTAEDLFSLVQASWVAEPVSIDTDVDDIKGQVNLVPMIPASEDVKLKRRYGQQC